MDKIGKALHLTNEFRTTHNLAHLEWH